MAGELEKAAQNELATRNRQVTNTTLEDVQLIFRNFKGEEGQYNREGDRNFSILLDEDLALRMKEEGGWNVKPLRRRDETDEQKYHLPIAVSFKGRPPRLVLITSKGRTSLDEDGCVFFDWVDIAQADLVIRPYHWNVSGKSGTKAYLQAIYVTMEEDYLMQKYEDVPEIGADDPLELPNPEDNQSPGDSDDVIDVDSWEADDDGS